MVVIKSHRAFRSIICCDDRSILQRLVDYFTDTYQVKVARWNRVTRKNDFVWEETTKCHGHLDKFKNELKIFRGLTFFAIKYLSDNKIPFKVEVDLLGRTKLSEKWIQICSGRDGQLEAVNKLISMKSGTCQLPTGFGKTEMILATIDAYLNEYPDRHTIVTVFRNPVGKTIELRLARYGMSEDPRIRVINAIGFMKSKKATDEIELEWMSKVGLIIHDEAHHCTADSYIKLFSVCHNVDSVYGFSATISQDNLLDYSNYKQWSVDTHTILSYCGVSSVHKKAVDIDRRIDYIQARGQFGQWEEDTSYGQRVLDTCLNFNFRSFIRICLDNYSRISNYTFFMPIPFIESGLALHNWLVTSGYHSIYWGGGTMYTWTGQKLDGLEELNEFMKSNKVDIISATSSANEGVDLHSISGAILAFGKDWKFAVQAPGRAGRDGRVPLIINVYNDSDAMLLSQSRKRHNDIRDNYELSTRKWNFN